MQQTQDQPVGAATPPDPMQKAEEQRNKLLGIQARGAPQPLERPEGMDDDSWASYLEVQQELGLGDRKPGEYMPPEMWKALGMRGYDYDTILELGPALWESERSDIPAGEAVGQTLGMIGKGARQVVGGIMQSAGLAIAAGGEGPAGAPEVTGSITDFSEEDLQAGWKNPRKAFGWLLQQAGQDLDLSFKVDPLVAQSTYGQTMQATGSSLMAILPAIATGGSGALAPAVTGLTSAAAEASGGYYRTLEETGDEGMALAGGLLYAGAGATEMIGGGRFARRMAAPLLKADRKYGGILTKTLTKGSGWLREMAKDVGWNVLQEQLQTAIMEASSEALSPGDYDLGQDGSLLSRTKRGIDGALAGLTDEETFKASLGSSAIISLLTLGAAGAVRRDAMRRDPLFRAQEEGLVPGLREDFPVEGAKVAGEGITLREGETLVDVTVPEGNLEGIAAGTYRGIQTGMQQGGLVEVRSTEPGQGARKVLPAWVKPAKGATQEAKLTEKARESVDYAYGEGVKARAPSRQNQAEAFWDEVSKQRGAKLVFVKGGEGPAGFYTDDGTIVVNEDAPSPLGITALHELWHRAHDKSGLTWSRFLAKWMTFDPKGIEAAGQRAFEGLYDAPQVNTSEWMPMAEKLAATMLPEKAGTGPGAIYGLAQALASTRAAREGRVTAGRMMEDLEQGDTLRDETAAVYAEANARLWEAAFLHGSDSLYRIANKERGVLEKYAIDPILELAASFRGKAPMNSAERRIRAFRTQHLQGNLSAHLGPLQAASLSADMGALFDSMIGSGNRPADAGPATAPPEQEEEPGRGLGAQAPGGASQGTASAPSPAPALLGPGPAQESMPDMDEAEKWRAELREIGLSEQEISKIEQRWIEMPPEQHAELGRQLMDEVMDVSWREGKTPEEIQRGALVTLEAASNRAGGGAIAMPQRAGTVLTPAEQALAKVEPELIAVRSEMAGLERSDMPLEAKARERKRLNKRLQALRQQAQREAVRYPRIGDEVLVHGVPGTVVDVTGLGGRRIQVRFDRGVQAPPSDVDLETQLPTPALEKRLRQGSGIYGPGSYRVVARPPGTSPSTPEIPRFRQFRRELRGEQAVPKGVLDQEAAQERMERYSDERMDATLKEYQENPDAKPALQRATPPKHTALSGELRGSPGLTGPADLAKWRKSIMAKAWAGRMGRFWYPRSSKAILQIAQSREDADLLVNFLAITSAATDVRSNTFFSLKAFYRVLSGERPEAGRYPASMSRSMEKAVSGQEWAGRKRNNFYRNLMSMIDPSLVQGSTVDMWMGRAAGYEPKASGEVALTDARYEFMEKEVDYLARRLGWEGHEAQAAIWTAEKAAAEGVTPNDLALNDFSTMLENLTGQMSWEATPGSTTQTMPEMETAPWQQRVEYLMGVESVLSDQHGNSIVMQRLGILSPGRVPGVGVFQGVTNPGRQTEVVVAASSDGMTPEARDALDAASAALGILLRQNAMAWHVPVPRKARVTRSGLLDVDIGRPLNRKESVAMTAALKEAMGTDWFSPIATPRGFRLLNIPEATEIPNKVYHAKAAEVVGAVLERDATIEAYEAETGYTENDWSKDSDGQGYLQAGWTRREDLFRRVRDLVGELAPAVDDVGRKLSRKYGWTFRERDGSLGYDPAQPEPSAPERPEAQVDRALRDWGGRAGDVAASPRDTRFRGSVNPIVPPSFRGTTPITEPMTRGEKAITFLQDSLRPLRSFQKQVEERQGDRLPENIDPYLGEELRRGKTKFKIERVRSDYVEPMVASLKGAGITLDEANEYAYALHAQEANAYLRTINEDIPDPSGMSDEDARAIKARWANDPRLPAMQEAHGIMRQLAERKLDDWVSYGLETQEFVDALRRRYQSYVPLKTTREAEFPGLGQGLDIRGKHESKRRLGRSSLADHPLSNLLVDVEATIIRGEKNGVLQRLVALLNAHPDNGFAQVDPPQLTRGINAQGMVGLIPDPRFFQTQPNIVAYKDGGKVGYIVFNEEFTSVAQALKNEGAKTWGALQPALRVANSYVSATLTRWNLAFLPVNVARDVTTAYVHNVEQGYDFANAVLMRWGPSVATVARGKLGRSGDSTYDAHYKEYVESGAPISILGMREDEVERRANELERALAGARTDAWWKVASNVKKVFDVVEGMNDIGENATRFAAFVELRERGESLERAASYAKNMTTNFERKGQIGPMLSAAYVFANAGIQGTARSLQALHSPRVVKAVGIMALGSVALDALNASIGGEDDEGVGYYEKIPAWKKRTHFILMTPWRGKGTYISWPMPQTISPLLYLGTAIGEARRGERTTMEAVGSWMTAAIDQWNVLGGGGDLVETILPTVADPFYLVTAEKTPFGTPLMPLSFDPDTPDSQRYWSRTSPALVDMAQWLNRASGGDEVTSGAIDVSPETLMVWTRQLFGGIGAESMRALGAFQEVAAGEAPKIENIPAVRRFAGSVVEDDRYDKGLFSEYTREVKRYRSAMNKAVAATDSAAIARLRRDYPGYDSLSKQLTQYEARLRKYKQRGRDEDAAKTMQRFNRRYQEVTR